MFHAKHVTYTAMLLAKELNITGKRKKNLYYATLLHDIGASNAYNLKDHTIKGKKISEKLPLDIDISEFILYHHEMFNGGGVFQLKGDLIPLEAQIIFICDLFDTRFSEASVVDYNFYNEIKAWLLDIETIARSCVLSPISARTTVPKEHTNAIKVEYIEQSSPFI